MISPSAIALSHFPLPVFDQVNSVDAILNLVTAATGDSQFEMESRRIFAKNKFNLSRPFVSMEFDGRKIHIDGLAVPITIGASSSEFNYKKIPFFYDSEKSVSSNFKKMQKVWGHFKELDLTPSFRNHRAKHYGSSGLMLLSAVGVTSALSEAGFVISSYFGYKWFRNGTEPLKLECAEKQMIQTKGKDRLVVEMPGGENQTFYSEIGGKKDLEGELEKITLHGKESYVIAHGNAAVGDLRTDSVVELRNNLMVMEGLCADPEELEAFNTSSKHIQDAIKSGKVKLSALPNLDLVDVAL